MKVPDPVTLRDAVREVIRQNREVGYSPGRFIQLTENGEAEDLVSRCQNLVNDPATFDILFDGVAAHPAFLSLEDLIAHSNQAGDWGLDDASVIEARARAEALNSLRERLHRPRFG